MLEYLAIVSYAVAGPPDGAMLRQGWSGWQDQLHRESVMPVALRDEDLDRIAAGEVARLREKFDGVDRVVGATWSDLPRDALWVAILDDACHTLVKGLTERHLPPELPGQKILFQHIRLPWPLAARQWIIDIRNNRTLFEASQGGVWERTWTLADRVDQRAAELSPAGLPDPAAVWTPRNEGGWLLVDAAGGTLVVYHGRADVGGAVPAELSTRYALSTLEELLLGVVERAGQVGGHYRAGHVPILRPDGSAVPAG